MKPTGMTKQERIAKLSSDLESVRVELVSLGTHEMADPARDYYERCQNNVVSALAWAYMLERESA